MWLLVFVAAAQPRTSDSGKLFNDILPWLIVLIAVVLIGGVVIFFVRRWLRGDTGTSAAGFTLQDLRELHARGELTDEQFQNAKSMMIGRLGGTISQSKSEDEASSPGNHRQIDK